MKQFHSPIKDNAYLIYRLISPIIDPLHIYLGIKGYFKYIKDFLLYRRLNSNSSIKFINLYPIVSDAISLTPFDAHYYFQGIWLLKNIIQKKPKKHVDIASKYELCGYLSLITKTEFVDIRPIETNLKNLKIVKGDITNLPYATSSLESISSLHVVEHIGLGRYGDRLDPEGTKKACKELIRVLKPGGLLYLSTPIGKSRVCFNAHRIHEPKLIINYCSSASLIEFSVVDDQGKFFENTNYSIYTNQSYACGMFVFQKNK